MIINHKIKHTDLTELIVAHNGSVYDALLSINVSEIDDDTTRIIARTILHSVETFVERIQHSEDELNKEPTDATSI